MNVNAPAKFDVNIAQIRNHYDHLSFWYRTLWGEHIHHGYWEDNESVATAQIQLNCQAAASLSACL